MPALLLLLVLLVLPSIGCEKDSPSRSGGRVPLQVRVRFPETAVASAPAAIEEIRIAALLPGVATPVDRAFVPIAPGQTHFSASLEVPEADLYHIEVVADGTRTSGRNRTERGSIYLGAADVLNVLRGSSPTVEVDMRDIVPRLSLTVRPRQGYDVRWTTVEGATRYRLRSILPQGGVNEQEVEGIEVTVVTPALLAPNGGGPEAIAYRVRAEFAGDLRSAFSESLRVFLPANEPPAAVTDLRVSGAVGNGVQLDWTSPGDDGTFGQATAYDVRFALTEITESTFETATGIPNPPAPGPALRAEHLVTPDLLPGTRYFFALRTRDEVPNWSPLSNVVVHDTPPAADVTPPAAARDLRVLAVADGRMTLAWTDPGDDGLVGRADHHEVRWSLAPLADATFDAATLAAGAPSPGDAGGAAQFEIAGLPRDVAVFASLRTFDEAGNGSPIATPVSALIPDQTPPGAVTDLVATLTAPTAASISWTAPGDDGASGTAAAFDLRFAFAAITPQNFAAASEALNEPPPPDAGARVTLSVTDLTPNTRYFFALVTRDNAGNASPLSNVAEVVTSQNLPSPPDLLAADVVLETSIHLTWRDNEDGEVGYIVERQGPNDADFSVRGSTGGFEGQGEFLDSGLPDQTFFRYRVRTRGASSVSLPSNEATATTRVVSPSEVAARALTSDALRVSWLYSARPVTGFRVERLEAGATWVPLRTVGPNARELDDVGLTPDTEYTYRVVSVSGAAESTPSLPATGRTNPLEPRCSLDVTSLDFGLVAVGAERGLDLRVSNSGGGLLGIAVRFRGCDNTDFSLAPGSPADFELASGEGRTLTVLFHPSTPGPHACSSLEFGTACGAIQVLGAGDAQPRCLVTNAFLDFQGVPVGESAEQTFTLANTGGGLLTGTVTLGECGAFSLPDGVEGLAQDYALGATETVDVRVRFTPPGASQYTCVIDTGLPCTPDVSAQGFGDPGPICAISTTSILFDPVEIGHFASQTFQIQNSGTGHLHGTFTPPSCPAFTFTAPNGGVFDVTPDTPYTITVRFTPSAEGNYTCQVPLAAPCAGLAVEVSGDGFGVPVCALSTQELTFGLVQVGTSASQAFSISNLGTGGLPVNVPQFPCAGFEVTSGFGPGLVLPGNPLSVTVRFAPGTGGPFSCAIPVSAACGSVSCSGTGLDDPLCIVSVPALDFGTLDVGEVRVLNVTIRNGGGGVLIGAASLPSSPHFSLVNEFNSYELTAEDPPFVVPVRYRPDFAGFHTINLDTGCDLLVPCSGTAVDPNSHWWDGFEQGVQGTVYALTDWNSKLTIGGEFTVAGGLDANFATQWDGSVWTAMASGPGGVVYTLLPMADSLAAGGPMGPHNVARFHPTPPNWATVFPFLDNQVTCLALWNGNLVAGGEFMTSQGSPCAFVAERAGASWTQLGTTQLESPYALEVWNGDLYAAGTFETETLHRIAKWGGVDWEPVSTGTNGTAIKDMVVWNDQLVIGGSFTTAGGVTCRNIAIYDGTNFQPVGTGTSGEVDALAVWNGDLIAGGFFIEAGGITVNSIARWDGITWHAFGAGVDGAVWAIQPYNGDLYVGGPFSTAGNKASHAIARWIP